MSQEDIVRFDDLLQVDRIVFFRSTLERIEYGYQITTGEAVLCVCVGDVVGVGIVQVEDLVHGADLERLVDVLEYRSLGFVDALHLLDVGEVLHALVGLLEGKGQAREELDVYPVNVVLGQLPRLHDVGVVQVAVAREVLVVPDVIVERVRSEDAEEDVHGVLLVGVGEGVAVVARYGVQHVARLTGERVAAVGVDAVHELRAGVLARDLVARALVQLDEHLLAHARLVDLRHGEYAERVQLMRQRTLADHVHGRVRAIQTVDAVDAHDAHLRDRRGMLVSICSSFYKSIDSFYY